MGKRDRERKERISAGNEMSISQRMSQWRSWEDVMSTIPHKFDSKEELLRVAREKVRSSGLTLEVEDRHCSDEELGNWDVVEITLKCPHGIYGDTLSFQRDDGAITWIGDFGSTSWESCPVCRVGCP